MVRNKDKNTSFYFSVPSTVFHAQLLYLLLAQQCRMFANGELWSGHNRHIRSQVFWLIIFLSKWLCKGFAVCQNIQVQIDLFHKRENSANLSQQTNSMFILFWKNEGCMASYKINASLKKKIKNPNFFLPFLSKCWGSVWLNSNLHFCCISGCPPVQALHRELPEVWPLLVLNPKGIYPLWVRSLLHFTASYRPKAFHASKWLGRGCTKYFPPGKSPFYGDRSILTLWIFQKDFVESQWDCQCASGCAEQLLAPKAGCWGHCGVGGGWFAPFAQHSPSNISSTWMFLRTDQEQPLLARILGKLCLVHDK